MKKIFISIMGLLVVLACNQKPNSLSANMEDDEDMTTPEGTRASDADTLVTSMLTYEYDADKVQCMLNIEWPESDGSRHLLNAVREFINEKLGGIYMGDLADGNSVVNFYGDSIRNELVRLRREECDNVEEDYINGFYRNISISKTFETQRMVTFEVSTEVYLNGAHGTMSHYGISFRKGDGRRFGYDMMRDLYTESMYELVKNGLKEYFSEGGASVVTDDDLKEYILSDDDVNALPLPHEEPYFTEDGLMFVYQPYEISFYAAGMPQFCVPRGVIMPFLTVSAKRLME